MKATTDPMEEIAEPVELTSAAPRIAAQVQRAQLRPGRQPRRQRLQRVVPQNLIEIERERERERESGRLATSPKF